MHVFKWVFLASIGALLAGCASDHKVLATLKEQVTITGPSCSFPRLVQLKMEKIDGGWTVPAKINDYNVRLTVDTGASDILISRAAAVAMELPVDEDARIETFIGFGGASAAKPVKTRHFVVGGFDIQDESAAVAPFKTNYQVSPPVVGLLGLSYLAAFDVEIDFARQTLSLYGSNHCGRGFLPWEGPYETLPLKNKFDDYARVDLTVDGHPLEAVLDTGAENLAASQFGAWEAGLSNERILSGRQYTAITPDGKNPTFHEVTVDEIKIGNLVLTKPTIGAEARSETVDAAFNNLWRQPVRTVISRMQAPMLVGLSFLEQYRVWISFSTHQAFLAPVSPLD